MRINGSGGGLEGTGEATPERLPRISACTSGFLSWVGRESGIPGGELSIRSQELGRV